MRAVIKTEPDPIIKLIIFIETGDKSIMDVHVGTVVEVSDWKPDQVVFKVTPEGADLCTLPANLELLPDPVVDHTTGDWSELKKITGWEAS